MLRRLQQLWLYEALVSSLIRCAIVRFDSISRLAPPLCHRDEPEDGRRFGLRVAPSDWLLHSGSTAGGRWSSAPNVVVPGSLTASMAPTEALSTAPMASMSRTSATGTAYRCSFSSPMAAPFGDVPASGTAYRASSTSPSAAPFDNVRSSLPGKTMDAQISSPSYRRSVAVTGVHAGIVDALESGVQVRLAGALDGCRRHGALEDVVELGAEASDDGLVLADEAAPWLALDGHLTEALLQLYRVPVSSVKLCLLLPQMACCERHRCMHQRLALPLLGLL
ncbi:hypothetical protein GUJ93_ZPchr0012g18825 [Zizania palustris]|uniref:Uncharacterized protein n=1 Tax=Zizania palustris TaxID=103762 RepID=A0A8J6BZQ5_ZIZPA|nr:hypothetical protein GUJ93_ZPchr0012g18825 [Zizania palustris]